jgi:hypothetical protein
MEHPSAAVPALARGLAATRIAEQELKADPDVVQLLDVKEQQFEDAISAALGIAFDAVAQTPDPVVPGQAFDVRMRLTNNGDSNIQLTRFEAGGVDFGVAGGVVSSAGATKRGETLAMTMRVIAPADVPVSRPYFTRSSIAESRYTFANDPSRYLPWSAPRFAARARYEVDHVAVDLTVPVTRREPQLPYGFVSRELAVLPALAVNVSPRQAIVPFSSPDKKLIVQVEVVNNVGSGSTGNVALTLPPGWTSTPATLPFSFARAGEKARYRFLVGVPATIDGRVYDIQAVASSNGRAFTQGYDVVDHRDLETRYLFHEADSHVRGVDVKIASRLKVGYVMGVGDDVPAGITQLGAQVKLLEGQDLAAADLAQYDAIVTGTRAYAVRDDLRTYNRRLLDYVQNGGNLIVLYNTPAEFDPNAFAPFPAQLPRDAEEVSEEDSPVTILSPQRPEFTTPNAIAAADFDGWVEQRGSKFFSQWDRAYTPMIETHDQGQPPQRGGWLTADYGKGHYTYFAYAFHRQLPYGVPGAYRLLANLLSLGKGESNRRARSERGANLSLRSQRSLRWPSPVARRGADR